MTHLSYPGGPPALVVRLDRHDLAAQFWAVARRTWLIIPVFVALLVVFINLNTRPNLYGLLATVCIGLIAMAALSPGAVVATLWMSTYYFDQRWIAWYVGTRRRSLDMAMVSKVTSRWSAMDGCWAFTSSKLSLAIQLRIPAAILMIDEVRALVASGLAVADRAHTVKLDERTRTTLGQPPSLGSADDAEAGLSDGFGRPPFRPWAGMPRRVNVRSPHRGE